MRVISKFFLDNYKFTMVVTFFTLVFGVTGLLSINNESFPTVNIGAVVISTRYDGATAEDIETKITKPLEEEIQKVSGLKKVKSVSQSGFSTIVTEADIDKYDVEKVIADLQRAVDRAQLPTDLLAKPLFSEIKTDEFPVVELAVIGDNTDRKRDAIVDILKEDLKDNKKVSTVSYTGFRERQFNIFLDRQALEKNHVAISEVQRALSARNVTIPGGEIKGEETQKLLRIEGKAQNEKELGEIVIRSNFSGQKILLKDIAQIEDSEQDPETLARYAGKPAAFLTVAKKSGADLLAMESEINALLDNYREKYGSELEFKIYNNEAIRVTDRLNVLISNGWQGLILVILILMIFIKGRVGFMAALSLPISLAVTLGIIYTMGYTLNTITIIGFVIALGMLVDNSVVVAENYIRLKKEGMDGEESLLTSITTLWSPITATALTTVGAFLPMLVTTGVMGQFVKAIPIVVSIALLVCLIEVFILLPARMKIVDKGVKADKEVKVQEPDYFDRKIVPAFENQVRWLVKNRFFATLIFIGLFVGAIGLIAFGVKFDLFPSEQTEIYLSRLEAPKGTRIEATDGLATEITNKILDRHKEKILHIVHYAGSSAVDPSDPKGEVGSNVALIKIFVNKDTQLDVKAADFLRDLRENIVDQRLTRISFEALVNGPPVGEPVSITLRSNDLEQLNKASEHIKNTLVQTKGIFDARIDDVFGDDEILVNVDFEKAARLGLSLADIGSTIRTAVAGQEISDVNLNNREVAYNLRFKDVDRNDISKLENLKVDDAFGNLIPLGKIAQFSQQKGAPQIKRYDFRRSKTVLANLDTDVISSPQANAIAAKEFELIKDQYKDVSLVFGGEQEDTNESVASLFQALILSLIAIFALLVLVFKSYSSPFIILSTIPLGLVGVALGFFVQQKVLSFMAIIGIIGVGGIIVNAGIILIAFIEELRSDTTLTLDEVLVKASGIRLRSVVVTTVTTALGLVPTAYGIGGSDYFIIPMALAILTGLTAGTVLTLYWVPPAYSMVASLKNRFSDNTKNNIKVKLKMDTVKDMPTHAQQH
jgi:multidrug efflux pump subunit AcrB